MKPWEKIIPVSERKWLKEDHQTVVCQCLTDLGYLAEGEQNLLKEALIQFRKESKKEQLLSPKAAASLRSKANLEEEILLKKLLSLEGEIPVFQLPAQGAQHLSVRLLHYRLYLLGLLPFDQVSLPFSPKGLQALHQLGQWLKLPADSPELLRLCGDLNALIHQLHQKGELDRQVVCFKFSSEELPDDLRKEVKQERGLKESEKDLQKAEKDCDRKLQKLEGQILDKEEAERQRLENRNQTKQKKLQRISLLMQQLHLEQKKLFQQRMEERGILQKKITRQKTELSQKRNLLQSMEDTLAQIKDLPIDKATKRKKKKLLKEQIKARKELIGVEEKKEKQLQKEWDKLLKKQEQEQTAKQKKLSKLQIQLKDLRIRINGLRFRFKGQLKRSLKPSVYKKVVHDFFAAKDQSQLEKQSSDPFNLFLIRLLQLHQWTTGYYNGRIDSNFAGKTFGAIAEMAEDLPRLRLKYILTALQKQSKGFWVLNIAYLIDRFCKLHPLGAPAPEEQKIMEAYLAQNTKLDSGLYNDYTQKIRAQEVEQQIASAHSGEPPRRIYFGRSSLLRSFGRVIQKIGSIIYKGLKATWQILKNFVRMLYEDLRESVVLFTQSLGFLFGKRRTLPLGEKENWDIPQYQYDETLSVEENTTAAETHFAKEAQRASLPTKSIQSTLKILAQVAKFAIALATGSLTWPALLTKLILFCRRWFFRWLKGVLLERRGELFVFS